MIVVLYILPKEKNSGCSEREVSVGGFVDKVGATFREDADRYSATQYALLGNSPRLPEPVDIPLEDISIERLADEMLCRISTIMWRDRV